MANSVGESERYSAHEPGVDTYQGLPGFGMHWPTGLAFIFQSDRLLNQPVIIPDDSNARVAALVPKLLRNHKVTASNRNEPARVCCRSFCI